MNDLLNKEIIEAYGFKKVEVKSKSRIQVFTFNKVDIVLSDDGSVYYSNLGFDYILKDEEALKKLYKELRREELLKVHP
ncbi:MAG: hypothetical protein ABIP51_06305 [Bacteroidia bacterium]